VMLVRIVPNLLHLPSEHDVKSVHLLAAAGVSENAPMAHIVYDVKPFTSMEVSTAKAIAIGVHEFPIVKRVNSDITFDVFAELSADIKMPNTIHLL
jgi:hypothetical protein